MEHVKDLLLGAAEIAQQVKCLPHQLEALSFDPPTPCKKQVHLYKSVPPPPSPSREVKVGEAKGHAGQSD